MGSTGAGGAATVGVRRSAQFYPGLAAFTDAIEALPHETIRHFTLLREVDAKACGPEELLRQYIRHSINLPSKRDGMMSDSGLQLLQQIEDARKVRDDAILKGELPPRDLVEEDTQQDHSRRSRLHQARTIISDLLLTLDEKIHVISTASEALSKHMSRVDDAYAAASHEIDAVIRDGSPLHWAYQLSLPTGFASRGVPQTASSLHSITGTVPGSELAVSEYPPSHSGNPKAESRRDLASRRHAHFPDAHDTRFPGNNVPNHSLPSSSALADGSPHPPPAKRRKGASQMATSTGLPAHDRSNSIGKLATSAILSHENGVPGTPRKLGQQAGNLGAHNGKTSGRKKTSGPTTSTASSPVRPLFNDLNRNIPNPEVTGIQPQPQSAGSVSKAPTGRNARNKTQQSKTDESASAPIQGDSTQPVDKQNLKSYATPPLPIQALGHKHNKVEQIKESSPQDITKETPRERKSAPKPPVVNSAKVAMKEERALNAGPIAPSSPGKDASRESVSEPHVERGANNSATKTITKQPGTAKSAHGHSRKTSTSRIHRVGKANASKKNAEDGGITSQDAKGDNAAGVIESEMAGAGGPDGDNRNRKRESGQAAGERDELKKTRQEGGGGEDEEDEDGDPDEMRYCYCNQVSYGRMVACDGPQCRREWFHLTCVGLTHLPSTKDKWFCNDCRIAMAGNGKQGKSTHSKP